MHILQKQVQDRFQVFDRRPCTSRGRISGAVTVGQSDHGRVRLRLLRDRGCVVPVVRSLGPVRRRTGHRGSVWLQLRRPNCGCMVPVERICGPVCRSTGHRGSVRLLSRRRGGFPPPANTQRLFFGYNNLSQLVLQKNTRDNTLPTD